MGRPGSALAQRAGRPGVSPGHTASPRWCTCTALACLDGLTDGCRAASGLTWSCCTAAAPPASTSARDRLELALAPLSSTSTLSDSMPPEVDAAASSTTGQCSGSVPMADSSRAGWLCSSELRKHHSPSDGRWSEYGWRHVSWASSAPPAMNRSLTARPEAASVR